MCRLDALKPVGNLVAHRAFSVRFITTAVIVDHIMLWLMGIFPILKQTHTYVRLKLLITNGHCAYIARALLAHTNN